MYTCKDAGPDDGVNNIEHYPCRADDDTGIAGVEAVPRHPLRKVPRLRNVVHRIYCWNDFDVGFFSIFFFLLVCV